MPNYLDSDLNDASSGYINIVGIHNAFVYEKDMTPSKANAPMATLGWEIYEGEFTGRKIRFDTVMLGGLTKDGNPQNLGKLCSLLHYAGLPWQCKRCKKDHSGPKQFLIATAADKAADPRMKVGNYYCPSCRNPEAPSIRWDTDVLLGARCGVRIGPKKKQEGSTNQFDEIKGYTDFVVVGG